jgi:L-amino acid N-acyltransferase YncA
MLASGDCALLLCLCRAYRSQHSFEYVKQAVTENISVCVRLVGPGGAVHPPVAWSLNYNDGSIGMGYAVAEHRQKGLMQVVLTHLVDRVLQARPDKVTYAFVLASNTASQALMHSLGFRKCSEDQYWMGWSKKQPTPCL